MKIFTKHSLIAFVLFLTALFMGCSTENVVTDKGRVSELKSKLIGYNELLQNPKLLQKLDDINHAKALLKSIKSNKYDFSIDTEKVLLIEKGDYKSYTFVIRRDSTNGYFENLFLHPYKNGYLAYLFRYDLLKYDLNALNNGTAIAQNFSELQFASLEDLDLGGEIGVDIETTVYGGGSGLGVIMHEGQCWRVNHVWINKEGLLMWDIVLCPGCEGCGDGFNSSGGSGGGSSGGGVAMQQYLAIWDLAGGSGGGGNGSGSGTGGGGSSGGGSNSGGYNPFNPPVQDVTNPNPTPGGPGLYFDDPIIGILSPDFNALELFKNSLTSQQKAFWENQNNIGIVKVLKDYLVDNSFDTQSKNFVRWAIGYFILHPNTPIDLFKSWFMGESEGEDGVYDAEYWENPNLTFPPQNLPSWSAFNSAFPKKNGNHMPSSEVYQLVGGQLYSNHLANQPAYSNACAIRVSRALNYSGVVVPNIPGQTEKGADNKNYFISAANLNAWMKKVFGNPTNHFTGIQGGAQGVNFPALLANKKGIYIMIPKYPAYFASGHADIWNGISCNSSCYFNIEQTLPNGNSQGVAYINLWQLN